MARQGVTYEQVAAAAEALVSAGQQPTIRAVRERLGGSGSPNTIHRHLCAWRAAHPAAPVQHDLPKGLAAAIAAEIERAVSQARAEIEERLAQAQKEAFELAAAGEALEAERDALAARVAEVTRERDMLAGRVLQLEADLAEERQRAERARQAAEAARTEAAVLAVRLEAAIEAQNAR